MSWIVSLLRLHKEIFPQYDCNSCRNCCKLLHAEIPTEEIDTDAAFLNMSREDFISGYLERGDFGEWTVKNLPCGFLDKDGICKLGDCRPENCKNFPYTDQPERLRSLYSVLTAVSVCPAAYEIFEVLKKEYGFHTFQKRKHKKHAPADLEPDAFFIAGYSSWGFPYGSFPTADEEDDLTPSDDLPF